MFWGNVARILAVSGGFFGAGAAVEARQGGSEAPFLLFLALVYTIAAFVIRDRNTK